MKWNKEQKNVDVNLSDMHPNPKNPRKKYDKQDMEELKLSLQSMGQLNSCVLDAKGNLLIGHRRHFAAKELDWKTLRCDIKCNLSEFDKSAIMISSNSTQVHFSCWEHREAIARIYWDEFLEEYSPRTTKDKGYTTFAKKLGLSPSHIAKIIETSKGENKKHLKALKDAKVDADTTDVVLTAPKDLRGYLVGVATRRQKKVKDMGSSSRVRIYVRAAKRRAIAEASDNIDKTKFKHWIEAIEDIGFELGDYIIKKSEDAMLEKLEIVIRKHILGFYSKLKKHLEG